MSELSSKRRQLTHQLAHTHRHNFFAQQRTLLLAHYHPPSETTHIQLLRSLIHKSMLTNCLLEEVTHHGLLQQLKSNLERQDTRELELTMVLLANILIDDLPVRERDQAVRLALEALRSHLLGSHLQTNGNFLMSVGHCMSSLLYSIRFIEEGLAVEAERGVLEVLLQMMGVVMGFAEELDSEAMKMGGEVCAEMVRVLHRLVCDQEGSLEQCRKALDRNYPFFRQLIDQHSKLINTAFPHQFMHVLNEGLLQVYEIISESVSMDNFPLLFETETFTQIIFRSYLANHTQKCNKMMLLVLRNWLRDYAHHGNLYHLFALWQKTIEGLEGDETFWRSLLVRDELKEERSGLLVEMLREEEGFQMMGKRVEGEGWKDVVEHCCLLLQDDISCEVTSSALHLLYVCFQRSEGNDPQRYLANLGGEALLEYVSQQVGEWACAGGGEEVEKLGALADAVLYRLKQGLE